MGGSRQVITTACQTAGSIGTTHTVPFPYEFPVDSVYSIVPADALATSYAWEQSTDNSTWTAAPGNITTRSYPLPASSPPDIMYYRRRTTNACATSNTTNLLYAKAHELKYISTQTLGIEDKLAVAENGFATNYIYSEAQIKNVVILPTWVIAR